RWLCRAAARPGDSDPHAGGAVSLIYERQQHFDAAEGFDVAEVLEGGPDWAERREIFQLGIGAGKHPVQMIEQRQGDLVTIVVRRAQDQMRELKRRVAEDHPAAVA